MSRREDFSNSRNAANFRDSSSRGHPRRMNGEDNQRRRSRSPKNHFKKDYRRDHSGERDRHGSHHFQHNNRNYNQRARDFDYRNERKVGRDSRDESDNKDGRPSWENSKVRRHAEEIQQRKLIWSKSKENENNQDEGAASSNGDATTSGSAIGVTEPAKTLETAWKSRLAAATSDSKQMDKFQRLMGMKKATEQRNGDKETTNQNEVTEEDSSFLKRERQRQAELTANLDLQYAMARATTHMGRGKGLGFNG